ncbi:hypothetical protein C1H46_001709 [Malus baccata]|uniref:Retrotransposon gag domain-containing protein n=1 Tax=Malus baccata TaxID=106549 RepID=A0A540NNT6_MALBA|nr:hypothetical protein C1H46_001709 [Malus baccata]
MAIDCRRRYTLSDVDPEVVTIDVVCTEGIAPSQSHIVDVEDIPIFFGSDCIEGFLLLVDDVEKLFKTQLISEREMVKMVASCLDGDVGLWYDHMQESRRQQGKSPIQTWRWLKRLIVKRFFSDLYELYLEKTGQPIIRKEAKVMENDISLCQEPVEAKVEEKEQVTWRKSC